MDPEKDLVVNLLMQFDNVHILQLVQVSVS